MRMYLHFVFSVPGGRSDNKSLDTLVLLHLLRILRSNVHRLLTSGVPPQSLGIEVPGVQRATLPPKDAKAAAAADEPKFDVDELKQFLLAIIDSDAKGVLGAGANTHSDATGVIVTEAIDFLRVGLELFYAKPQSKMELVNYLLSHKDQCANLLAPALLEKCAILALDVFA